MGLAQITPASHLAESRKADLGQLRQSASEEGRDFEILIGIINTN